MSNVRIFFIDSRHEWEASAGRSFPFLPTGQIEKSVVKHSSWAETLCNRTQIWQNTSVHMHKQTPKGSCSTYLFPPPEAIPFPPSWTDGKKWCQTLDMRWNTLQSHPDLAKRQCAYAQTDSKRFLEHEPLCSTVSACHFRPVIHSKKRDATPSKKINSQTTRLDTNFPLDRFRRRRGRDLEDHFSVWWKTPVSGPRLT
jgi:hypothetical protein